MMDRTMQQLLKRAKDLNASDIHIVVGTTCWYRINGYNCHILVISSFFQCILVVQSTGIVYKLPYWMNLLSKCMYQFDKAF